MNSQIKHIRGLAKSIQQGKLSFQSLYKYLDTLEKINKQQKLQQDSSSSQDQSNYNLQQYVNPIRKMLNDYKQGINSIKKQNNQIQNTISQNKQNNPRKINKKDSIKNYSSATVQQLNYQIQDLTTKIQKCYLK